jgi:tyrosyl-tRNA synthetase
MEEAFEALGVPRTAVTYRYANEFAKDPSYWAMVVKVAKNSSLARVRRAMTILGRAEDEADSDLSKFFYPAMQVADIFHMGIDLAYGGLDQRHAHMLARDIAPKIGRVPPVAIHTPLVPSLKAGRMEATNVVVQWITRLGTNLTGAKLNPAGGPDIVLADGTMIEVKTHKDAVVIAQMQAKFGPAIMVMTPQELSDFLRDAGIKAPPPPSEEKMSKSDPDSGIFIHDSPEDIRRKLKGAHCPAKETEGNPVLDLLRLVVWPRLADLHKDGPARFEIHRPEKFGGNKLYIGLDALLAEYRSGALHPMDLKNGVADALVALLQPVRDYFAKHPDNWQFVQSLRKTR